MTASHEHPGDGALHSIRNVGIMAHIDAGKTTLTERILLYTGISHRLGDVDDGTATMDWMAQERERGITITAAATTCRWRDHRINLIDTPGHVDFTVEVERCLRVLDGAVAVFSAVDGVEPQSETVWRQADRHGVARVAFVNKCDRRGAAPERCVAQLRAKLGCHPIPVQLCLGLEEQFHGVVDLVDMQALTWPRADDGLALRKEPLDDALRARATEARKQLIEQLSEVDDDLLGLVLSGDDVQVSGDALRGALRRATVKGVAVPVLFGTALKSKGVQPLLDAIVQYLPAPSDLPPISVTDAAGEEVAIAACAREPLAALVFKVVNDRYGGQLNYVRVYAGALQVGDAVLNPRTGQRERVSRIVRMHANKREPVSSIAVGDLAAVAGLRDAVTGDTVCAPERVVMLERTSVPTPTLQVAITPSNRADHERLSTGLSRLMLEDPSIQVEQRSESGERLVRGMGELHLEILVDRLRREFDVSAEVSAPQIAYRETIRGEGSGEGKYLHHTQGKRQYGHVQLTVASADAGSGVSFSVQDDVDLPPEYLASVEQGARAILARGVAHGYAMTDLTIRVVGGSYSPVDSSTIAFQIAGALAAFEAASRAQPVLLEPIMRVDVDLPEEHAPAVMADLGARRGRVLGNGVSALSAEVPLSTMFGYASDLRSLTQGRAAFRETFARYAEVSAKFIARSASPSAAAANRKAALSP